jgi:hypothetical protein
LQVGDTGPVESARRSNSRVLGSPFSGLSGQLQSFRVRSHETGPLTEILTHSCRLAIFHNGRVTGEAARASVFLE